MFKAFQRLSGSLERTSDFIKNLGHPSTNLRAAILSGEEEKAIQLYTQDKNGTELTEFLPPSEPFKAKRFSDQTPLHLAAYMCFEALIKIFLLHGGNPNTLNAKQETCLHSLCRRGDLAEKRDRVLTLFLRWSMEVVDSEFSERKHTETVSLNRTDVDGNAAIHYAAEQGLILCVERLVRAGAIVSLVNKSQRTCCELADAAAHASLATMVELALVFQPLDENFAIFSETQQHQQHHTSRNDPGSQSPSLTVESISMSPPAAAAHVESIIASTCLYLLSAHGSTMLVSPARTEALLNRAGWDERILKEALVMDTAVHCATCQLVPAPAHPYIYEAEFAAESTLSNLPSHSSVIEHAKVLLQQREAYRRTHQSQSEGDLSTRSVCCGAGHAFCLSCWSAHNKTQVSDMGAPALSCPGYKCGEVLPAAWAPLLLEGAALSRWREQRVRHAVDCSPTMRWCTHTGCEFALRWDRASICGGGTGGEQSDAPTYFDDEKMPQNLVCAAGHAVCMQCGEEAHAPCGCADWKAWRGRVDREIAKAGIRTGPPTGDEGSSGGGDDIANALWVAANTKKCPRCQTPIEKDEGCNHMSCRKCRHEFCWICMKDWSSHSQQTGGYFQCNRFQAGSGADGGGTSEGPGEAVGDEEDEAEYALLFPEEAGNAHMEGLRMRQRGMRMARFIHHFTRSQAHADSAAMEIRMRQGTLNRIALGLIDSAPNLNSGLNPKSKEPLLRWLQGDLVPHPLVVEDSHFTHQTNFKPVGNCKSQGTPPGRTVDSSVSSKSAVVHTDSCREQEQLAVIEKHLQFLSAGFEELARSRHLLRGSYAFAFHCFADESELQHQWRLDQLADLLSSPSSADSGGVTPAQRRLQRRQLHMRMSLRKPDFEQLQSELESLTEMLSDVVARRRLRASKTMIADLTAATREKRLQLESMLSSWATVDRMEGIIGLDGADGGLGVDPEEQAALLVALRDGRGRRRRHRARGEHSGSSSVSDQDRDRENSRGDRDRENSRGDRDRENSRGDRADSDGSLAVDEFLAMMSMHALRDRDGDDPEHNGGNLVDEEANGSMIGIQGTPALPPVTVRSSVVDGASASHHRPRDAHDAAERARRDARRRMQTERESEELLELNRAIMLSLQEPSASVRANSQVSASGSLVASRDAIGRDMVVPQPQSAGYPYPLHHPTSTNPHDTDNPTPNEQQQQQQQQQPSEESIEALTAMGFDRTAVESALMRAGGSVDVAAELLLSITN